ncbi:cytochrome c [Croceibacterium aestuarii]|uniref:cytochrome c n=1 Tax=Croceibacterium aestuarii TaxID=3064139 RepID=UPI00272E141E|nr:cytochrome c [Croceibacterium sp. D39]
MNAAKSAHLATWSGLASLALGLSACSTVGDPPESSASMGLLIARDRCSGCHQTGGGGESPNPRAPTFREIVDRPGVTPETLAAFLTNSHNYPIEMGFRLEPHQVDSLVAYMVRWRSEDAASQS